MTELAYDFSGQNCFYGCPENPAVPGHLPGGSSSGCAVSAGWWELWEGCPWGAVSCSLVMP